ncbi:uncharacterized protein LOC134182711 [Corticium candelabrum]|uniref:uncharacterized protein LOC134182711 n=1 Tax=Corticium candelabrum TaxID=121492 RepID=UPI002E26FBD1|nr:uncharacterized protein LOC134182711 [Corticium candelabrum]
MRLGASLPVLGNIEKCIPLCGKDIDKQGYHLLTCKFGGGPIFRHDRFLDNYYNMLQEVGFHCRKELTAQFQNKQCPNIAVYDFHEGKKLLLDITITHPWAQSNISGSSTMAGFAAVEKEKQKDKKYRETAESLRHIFRPIAIEAFGCWGPKAEELLTETSKMAPMQLDMPVGQFKAQWSRHLSVTLQRLNLDIINKRALTIVGKKESGTSGPANLAKREFSFDFS